MKGKLQMTKRLTVFVLFWIGTLVVAKAQTAEKMLVKVEIQNLDTETFADVSCTQFDFQFNDTKRKIKFQKKDDLDALFTLIKKFKKIDDQSSFDVRGKLSFIHNGIEITYCFDNFAIFYTDGKYFKNVPLLRFIAKKAFDDNLPFLKER